MDGENGKEHLSQEELFLQELVSAVLTIRRAEIVAPFLETAWAPVSWC